MRHASPAALQHLLVSFPEPELADQGTVVLDAFVLGAAAQLAGELGRRNLISVEQLLRWISDKTELAFAEDEVRGALDRLVEKNRLGFTDRSKHTIALNDAAVREAEQRAETRRQLRDKVREAWLAYLRVEYPGLDDVAYQLLWDLLTDYLARLLNTRAAEAAAFLYADTGGRGNRFREAVEEGIDTIGSSIHDDTLRTIAQVEFPNFVLSDNDLRQQYVANLLKSSFYFHLLNIDPRASLLVRSAISEKILYVDTNVLFRLCAFHGPRLMHGPAMLLDISEDLHCTLRVARVTLDEFKRTLRGQTAELRQKYISRQTFREIAAEYLGSDLDFMAAYYRELNSGQTSNVDEFAAKYRHIDDMVHEWGIEIDETACYDKDLLDSEPLRNRYSALYNWCNGTKGQRTIEHDILAEHYVQAQRGGNDGSYGDVDVWFITYDRGLSRFVIQELYGDDGSAPFCILGTDWLQIVRPFLPRTEDYDQAFATMVALPLVMNEDTVPFAHVAEALHRLQKYEGLGKNVAAAMIAEQEFVRRLHDTRTGPEEVALVEAQSVKVASALGSHVDSLRAELDEERSARGRAEENERAMREEIGQLRSRLDRMDGGPDDLQEPQVEVRDQEGDPEIRRLRRWIRLLSFAFGGVMVWLAAIYLIAVNPLGSVGELVVIGWAVFFTTAMGLLIWAKKTATLIVGILVVAASLFGVTVQQVAQHRATSPVRHHTSSGAGV